MDFSHHHVIDHSIRPTGKGTHQNDAIHVFRSVDSTAEYLPIYLPLAGGRDFSALFQSLPPVAYICPNNRNVILPEELYDRGADEGILNQIAVSANENLQVFRFE